MSIQYSRSYHSIRSLPTLAYSLMTYSFAAANSRPALSAYSAGIPSIQTLSTNLDFINVPSMSRDMMRII